MPIAYDLRRIEDPNIIRKMLQEMDDGRFGALFGISREVTTQLRQRAGVPQHAPGGRVQDRARKYEAASQRWTGYLHLHRVRLLTISMSRKHWVGVVAPNIARAWREPGPIVKSVLQAPPGAVMVKLTEGD